MKKKLLLIEPTIRPIGVAILEKAVDVYYCSSGEQKNIIRCINENEIDAVIIRVERITKDIIENCPSLKLIGQHGVGVDNIDIQAATDNGIMVINVPDANYMSVAEHTILFILALSRNLLISDKKVRNDHWNYREEFYPTEINYKNLFILGLGRIGQEVARKAKAFHMNLLGYDPFVTKEEMELYGVKKIEDIIEGLKQADFVSIHVPLNKETEHLISAKELQVMKKNAFLINMSRGGIVNQADLFVTLKERGIAGAALDVLEQEPPNPNEHLLDLDNVILTPHFSGDTVESKNRCSIALANEVVQVMKGKLPTNLVNNTVLKQETLRLEIKN